MIRRPPRSTLLPDTTPFRSDANGNGLLDLTETWTYTKTATALAGQQTNVGTVTRSEARNPDLQSRNYLTPPHQLEQAPEIKIIQFFNGNDTHTPTDPHKTTA